MIQKSIQQDIDLEGQRLLEQALGPLGWVINPIEHDFGIDYDVQVFADGSPTGVWFKIQLKSSAHSEYSSDSSFISQQLETGRARHYALELRDPVFLIHADTLAKRVFWCAPQRDRELISKVKRGEPSAEVTARVPTCNLLPNTAEALLRTIEELYVILANRTLADSPVSAFAESLKHLPGENALREEFQHKNDVLKLRKVHELLVARQYPEARSRAQAVLSDPDSSIENRFWALEQLGDIDWGEAVNQDRPQSELPLIYLKNAKELQVLTKSGPSHLKFFALIVRKAAELDRLVIDNWGLAILLQQHRGPAGNLLMAVKAYADYAASTQRVIAKYNQCLRLARYGSNFRGRWILPRALNRIVQAVGSFIGRIGRLEFTEIGGAASQFHTSVLQICKLMAWIAEESGDQDALALAVVASLLPVSSQETDAFRWAVRTLDRITDPDVKQKAVQIMERHIRRWRGEVVEGDRYNNPAQQLVENAAASLGIDPSDESNPIVQGLRIAARDNTPERVLKTCEHILASRGATGPTARQIEMLFGIQTAGSKIIHCALHKYHLEAKDLDSAFAEFKPQYCDSCPDRAPRHAEWKYSQEFQNGFNEKHIQFIRDFNATGAGFRLTSSD
jgi:hypothetical protein